MSKPLRRDFCYIFNAHHKHRVAQQGFCCTHRCNLNKKLMLIYIYTCIYIYIILVRSSAGLSKMLIKNCPKDFILWRTGYSFCSETGKGCQLIININFVPKQIIATRTNNSCGTHIKASVSVSLHCKCILDATWSFQSPSLGFLCGMIWVRFAMKRIHLISKAKLSKPNRPNRVAGC